ncbi:MAG: metalloregulator ArsR/SmtB family transcription factor, partial [Xanthomonadales bacterium]|nr:metalloregulator ArsR/SmtB family transcription factor [Xanthomonadales bacterium]
MDLHATSSLLKVLSDPSRVRLLVLLENEELTVAELAQLTLLAQPRVSTHLARLRESGLVVDRKSGVQSYYRLHPDFSRSPARGLWQSLKQSVNDALLDDDRDRLPAVLAARARSRNWADTVAGDMERHYSPGRTWEATTRAMLQLLDLGDVLDVASGDGVLAELLAPRAQSVTCVDSSERVVEAGARRLAGFDNVRFLAGDMHSLDFASKRFDVVLLMHALTYTDTPSKAVAEAFRVLRKGGSLVGSTLKAHGHEAAVAPFNHVNQGFKPSELRRLCVRAGFRVET